MSEPIPLPKGRLEALTDGIFAVSMTLLVLDLKLPGAVTDQTEMLTAIVGAIPLFDDYVISFLVLCVFWLSHLRLLRRMDGIDPTFTWLNLAFLLFTTFVPMLTAFAGRNPGQPRPAFLYGMNLMAITACEMLMWRHALPRFIKLDGVESKRIWTTVRRKFTTAFGVVLGGLAMALVEIRLGWKSGYASYVYLLLIAVGIMQPTVRLRIRRRKDDAAVSEPRA